jgi:UDP-N-acetylmuramoyl-tripeptide--D-alanyl-D-alanine ligase
MNQGFVAKALWTAEDAAAAAHGRLIGPDSWIATGLSIDTRTLEPGDLFIALQDARDGHDFVADALSKGACAALVARVEGDGARLVVSETLKGLRDLAAGARARSLAKIAAITGSVGKTSVKEALASCLAASGPTHFAVKSFNNHIGVPLTLARMPAHSRFGVIEIGMNHRGEIKPLAALARPHVAIVTTIAPVHIEHLGSLATIADEKADIFTGLAPDGAALIPAEAEYADRLIAMAKPNAATVVRFGRGPECEARLLQFDPGPDGSDAEADILGRVVRYRVGTPGAQWALNSLAVLTATALMGADLEAAIDVLAKLDPAQGRGQAIGVHAPFGGFTLVDDAYNASPISVAAALDTLAIRPVGPGGRRIAVLGDMLELGPDEAAYHAGLAEPINRNRIDLTFCAGPRMRHLHDALSGTQAGGYAKDADSLVSVLTPALRAGDVVLVKGSNGSKMGRVVDALKKLGAA